MTLYKWIQNTDFQLSSEYIIDDKKEKWFLVLQ